MQQFLLYTSILAQLNEGLAEAVSGQANSRELLEKLDRNNLFLTSLDNNQEWYRYHPLFAEFLRGLLKRREPEQFSELHRRAANWYEKNGFEAEALTHSLEAGDYPKVIELLLNLVMPLIHRGESATVMGWFEVLPEDFLNQNPHLNNLFASALLVANRFDQMEAPLKRAENYFRQHPASNELVEYLALRAMLGLVKGETKTSKVLAQRTLELKPAEDNLPYALAIVILSSLALLEGALDEAESWLNRVWLPWVDPQMRNNRAQIQFMRGKLSEAEQQSQELLALNTRIIWQEGLAQTLLGRIYYQWNRLDEARAWLGLAISQSEGQGQSAYLPEAYLALAEVEWAEGKKEEAFQVLAKARQAAQHLGNQPLTAKAYSCENYFKALEKDLGSVWRWVEDQKLLLTTPEDFTYHQHRDYLTLVQALLTKGQKAEALLRLEWLAGFATEQGRVSDLVEILGLKALALAMSEQDEAAFEALSTSIQLATPGNLMQPYLNQGVPMQQLLKRLRIKRPELTLIEKLLAAFDTSNLEQEKGLLVTEAVTQPEVASLDLARLQPRTEQPLLEPLSERELEVLRLIEAGISNKAIADRLYLSLATVKTHINHLYAKLAVENRVQALARAHSLHLL